MRRFKRNLELYFPFIIRDMDKYKIHNDYELEIVLRDGRKILYDDNLHSIRNLPLDSNDMTEAEFRTEFGIRLYRMMQLKNISQLELSRLTGLTQPQISDYTYGRRTPSFYTVYKITKALDCSVDEFMYM